jgi:hypothetical protein
VRCARLFPSILVGLCSCAPDAAFVPADGPPTPLQIDVVITDYVTVYTSGSDLNDADCLGQMVFPPPGMTAQISDVVQCKHGSPRSCLTKVSLQIGATEHVEPHIHPGRRIGFDVDLAAAGRGELAIVGCGGSAVIALTAGVAPQPTLAVVEDMVTRDLTVTWSASPPAASALVQVSNLIWGDVAHVTASPFTYVSRDSASMGALRVVGLTTFASPVIAETSFGPVRIWTGGTTFESMQPPEIAQR